MSPIGDIGGHYFLGIRRITIRGIGKAVVVSHGMLANGNAGVVIEQLQVHQGLSYRCSVLPINFKIRVSRVSYLGDVTRI